MPRGRVFLQTKIGPEDLGYDATLAAFPTSLRRLRTAYVDSLLLHKPRCWEEGICSGGTWQQSWRALELLYERRQVRAVGMCDVDAAIFQELQAQRQPPHVVQNWMDPLHQDNAMRAKCLAAGVQYQAYSSLGAQWVHFKGHATNPVLTHPTLRAIARSHGVSVATVVLRWALQLGVAVIPSSRVEAHLAANVRSGRAAALSDAEMAAIAALDGTGRDLSAEGVVVGRGAEPAAVHMVFFSRSHQPLEVFWVPGNGDEKTEVLLGVLPAVAHAAAQPERTLAQRTFHGHHFRFRTADGGLVGEHVVDVRKGAKQRQLVAKDDAPDADQSEQTEL